MPTPGESGIREKDCPAHKHVEWDVSHVALMESGPYRPLRSPVFRIEKQSYVLQLECRGNKDLRLSVLWMGPRDTERSRTGQCWAGLKCWDGRYHHRNVARKLCLEEKHESWTATHLSMDIPQCDVEVRHRTASGNLTLFFRMNVGRVPVGTEACSHGTPPMPALPSGIIREEECSTHREVQWEVDYEAPEQAEVFLLSPVFTVGAQVYFFESRYAPGGGASIRVYRLGRSVEAPARCWLGLKCGDAFHPPEIFSDLLDMREDLGLWTSVTPDQFYKKKDLEDRYLTTGRRLTFFFVLNAESTWVETCTHGVPRMSTAVSGSIREEVCSSHTHVEWDIGRSVTPNGKVYFRSPVFEVGGQSYFLNLHLANFDSVSFSLSRTGGSMARSVRWWAGLMLSDGHRPLRNSSGELDLREELRMWTKVTRFIHLRLSDVDCGQMGDNLRPKIFFRINVGPTGEEKCYHGTYVKSSIRSTDAFGKIRVEECPSHKQVEWEVGHVLPLRRTVFMASPVFEIETQSYFLDLCMESSSYISLSLFRLGRSVPRSFRWWAGLRLSDGTYPLRNSSGELVLREELGLWTNVARLVSFCRPGWEQQHLTSDHRIKVFFRMNVEASGEGTCNHGHTHTNDVDGEGRIQWEDCPSHRHLDWDIDYTPSPRESGYSSTSPAFEVGNDRYHLHLRHDLDELVLELYRLGCSSDNGSSRCWVGLKSSDGFYTHRLRVAELDLRHECSMWTKSASFRFPNLPDLERTHVTSEGRLVVFLWITGAHSATVEGACTHGAAEMFAPGEGVTRHKDNQLVEWNVAYEPSREHVHISASPSLRIGDQSYLLELLYETDGVLELNLYRSGGRGRSVLCWAGLRRSHGTYCHCTRGAELDLRQDSELWTRVLVLGYFRCSDVEKQQVASDRLIFYFRVESSYFADAEVQTDGEDRASCEDGNLGRRRDYEDQLHRDYQLWLQHPEEGNNIRCRRRTEAEARMRSRTWRSSEDGDKLSFSAA